MKLRNLKIKYPGSGGRVQERTSAEILAKLSSDSDNPVDISPAFREWDFAAGLVDKLYMHLFWEPGDFVSAEEVRQAFRAEGAVGNTAVFLDWLQWWPRRVSIYRNRWIATVPPAEECPKPHGIRSVPLFLGDGEAPKLILARETGKFPYGTLFVAFR